MLPVGCRLPEFEPRRQFHEISGNESVADDVKPLLEQGCLLLKQVLHELEEQLEAMAA